MSKPARARAERKKVFVITGVSGAGKSQALKVFEDFGWFCVDNLPIALFGGASVPDRGLRSVFRSPLAVGVHARQFLLRGQIALLGGFPNPRDRLAHVLADAVARGVDQSEPQLRIGVASARAGFDLWNCLLPMRRTQYKRATEGHRPNSQGHTTSSLVWIGVNGENDHP